MKPSEVLVLVGSLLATVVFAADVSTWPADLLQPGAPAARDYSCTVVQDEVVCERNRTLIANR